MLKSGSVETKEDLFFNPLSTEVKDDKFLQQKFVDLSDEFIDYVINAKKNPIGDLDIGENSINLNFEFGSQNQMSTATLDYCSNGLKFCAMKDEENKLQLFGIYTINSPRGMSCGLYYLPNASLENICFIGRLCYHKQSNPHTNKFDDVVIGENVLHFHKQSKKYIDYCKQYFQGDDLIRKIQSPDATIIPFEGNLSIKQMTDLALKMFGVSNNQINVKINDENKIIESIISQINNIEREF